MVDPGSGYWYLQVYLRGHRLLARHQDVEVPTALTVRPLMGATRKGLKIPESRTL